MRKLFLPLFLFLYSFASSQNNLSFSRHSGVYTYVYKIDVKEAELLYRSGMQKAVEAFLHTLVDSFKTEIPSLRPGNYLLVRAVNNTLEFTLQTGGDVGYKLINNNRDLVVALHTKEGNLLTAAEVSINNKKLLYDDATKTYRREKYKKDGLLLVNYQNVLYSFPIKQYKVRRLSFFKRVIQSPPLKYIINPFRKLFGRETNRYSNYFYQTAHEQKFRGFAVFSKPKYKPGDTVRIKAFVTNAGGKPLTENLRLRLTERYFDVDTVITTITPYRPGAYEYSFVLSDSLDLDLDEEYLVTLEQLKGRNHNLSDYDGDEDEEEIALKRPVVMRSKFYYEEYELESVTLSARTDKQAHARGEEAAVFIKASDENGMPVMDGRVQIFVKPSAYGARKFEEQKEFLPDTLWQYEQPLETLGETKISVPDSIFSHASFNYEIECVFLNTNNERQTSVLQQSFTNDSVRISFEPLNDSLRLDYKVNGKLVAATATVFTLSQQDTIEQQTIRLPVTIKVNPFATAYKVKYGKTEGSYTVQNKRGMVTALASRTKDSVFVQLKNPYRLPVWYTVFNGNKIIFRGYGDSLSYAAKITTAKNYSVSLQYIYNNRVYNEDYTIPYQDKLLSVSVTQPAAVYPGQTAPVIIDVKDAEGNGVSGADVTAWAYTKKFTNSASPNVPYLGKLYAGRKRYANFSNSTDNVLNKTTSLIWERWSREMHLDTIEYYKFLHPQNIYINKEPAADSLTQIAPFVVMDGELQPVHHIYIDEVPVFFSPAQHLQRYSFAVSPGKHSFRLRTQKALIYLDSFDVSKGVKTFISINADIGNKQIRSQLMPDTLTNYEKTLWGKYTMLIENTFGERYAYLNAGDAVYLLNGGGPYVNPILTGPLPNRYAQLVVKNGFTQTFEAEGGYQFNISNGLIKQKQLKAPFPFSSRLPHSKPTYNFHDLVLTEKEIDSLWQAYLYNRSAAEDLFTNPSLNKKDNGQLEISIAKKDNHEEPFVRNILLFKYDDPDYLRIYKGQSRNLGYVQPGRYRLLFLLKQDAYVVKDSIVIKKDGINYYEADLSLPKRRDSVSIRISGIINSRDKAWRWNNSAEDFSSIKESFNEKYLDAFLLTETISGVVRDDKGAPIPFATVIIKGTRSGTQTNNDGRFTIKVLPNSTLVVSTVGYASLEQKLSSGNDYSFNMARMSQNLSEVVVTGYGTQMRRELSGSVSGISINGLAGSVPGIMIRGSATVNGSSAPLLIVDGLPFSGSMADIDPALIANISIVKAGEAVKLYGSIAANGVITITTKKSEGINASVTGDNLSPQATSLRRNFRDDAYWQPRLITNAEGKSVFTVTYPDDITAWRTFAIAMTDKKQSGYAEGAVRSFKSISGNLSLPLFTVEGDSITAIGKALNYTTDSISAQRLFYINNELVKNSRIQFRNSFIDTFAITPPLGDSLKLKYTIQKDDGYFDGEERIVPVYTQGVLETSGFFAALLRDTAFTIQPVSDSGTIKLYAESSVLPTLEKEVESLHRYEYLCNEQLASKLKGWLVQKKIDSVLKRPFRGDKHIREILGKLSQNKAASGLWGWWNNNEPAMWISLHVLEAMAQAQASGYSTTLNKALLIDYLIYNLESYKGTEKLSALHLLHLLNAKADYRKYTDSLQKELPKMNLYEKLSMAGLKQKAGLPNDIDSLLQKQSRTMLGNVYWGEESRRFFDNDIQCSIVMYRLLKSIGGYNDLLQKLRGYFLERRRGGQWRNTYESSLIMETILPDLLVNDSLPKTATITVTGNDSYTVNQFPYTAEVKAGQPIAITKNGSLPVYFTAYQQRWNKTPKKITGEFSVRSYFEKDGSEAKQLKAGSPIALKIAVTVKADASYVMIEVPIPAGCSYKDKTQHYYNNEVHREYFKNKVSIFCSVLKKGDHEFTISLLPRYTGSYVLNPAKAEMMYFPVFFGREQVKKVVIK